jgi:hypothetical protein
MDFGYILSLLYEIAYFLAVFFLFFLFALLKGRQAIMNVIIGLYFALLISLTFPYYDFIFGTLTSTHSIAAGQLGFFALITLLTTALCFRIMPDEFREKRFESFGRKLLLVFGATALVMVFSFNVLPVTEFLVPGTPIQSIFAPEIYYFWWLLVPLVILYVV